VDGNRWGRLSKLEEMKWKETRVVILMKTSVEVQVCSGDKDLKEYGTCRRSDKSRERGLQSRKEDKEEQGQTTLGSLMT